MGNLMAVIVTSFIVPYWVKAFKRYKKMSDNPERRKLRFKLIIIFIFYVFIISFNYYLITQGVIKQSFFVNY